MIRRWMVIVIAVLSLVLCLAVLGLGVLSFGRGRSLTRYGATPEAGGMIVSIRNISMHRGRIYLRSSWIADSWQTIRDENMGFQHGYEWGFFDRSAFRPADVEALGFGGYRVATAGAGFDRSVRMGVFIPVWFVVLVLAASSSIAWRRARQQRLRYHQRHSLCVACGYSLKGNASGVCPECGNAVTRASSSS